MSEKVNLPALPSGFGPMVGVTSEQTRTPYVSFIYAKSKSYPFVLGVIKDLRGGWTGRVWRRLGRRTKRR